MRQAVRIEGSQLVTEIRRECRERDKLVQAERGWKRCLHNRYLLDIIVDWNVTPCSLTDGTKSCHITQNIIHCHLHEKSHFIYLFSGIIRSMVPSKKRQKPATVFRSETEYRSWSIDKLLAKNLSKVSEGKHAKLLTGNSAIGATRIRSSQVPLVVREWTDMVTLYNADKQEKIRIETGYCNTGSYFRCLKSFIVTWCVYWSGNAIFVNLCCSSF
jgi:hypothetical protein